MTYNLFHLGIAPSSCLSLPKVLGGVAPFGGGTTGDFGAQRLALHTLGSLPGEYSTDIADLKGWLSPRKI